MADLRPLIRLYRWRLDEKQRALAELHTAEERLIAEGEQLEEEIRAEQRTIRDSFEVMFGYAGFAKAAIGRREHLTHALNDVRADIATASDQLAEAFQELKRFELAQEERVKREKERLRHKENEMLDETAAVGFRRRQQEDQGPEHGDQS